MRYFYDTEFLDTGIAIDLVSIGIVCEDGREYYAQSTEVNSRSASKWVQDNVFPGLLTCPYEHAPLHYDAYHVEVALHMHYPLGQCTPERYVGGDRDKTMLSIIDTHFPKCPWRTREQIKQEVLEFMNPEKYGKPELWSYYGAYDHVAFCQLFGTMMDLPPGYPTLTYDLRQWLDMYDLRYIRQPDDSPHNALEDARWVARTYKLCSKDEV